MSRTVQDVLSYLGAVVTACIFAFALLEIGRHLAGIRRELATLRELLSQPPACQPDLSDPAPMYRCPVCRSYDPRQYGTVLTPDRSVSMACGHPWHRKTDPPSEPAASHTYIQPCEARGPRQRAGEGLVCKRSYGHSGEHRARVPFPPYTVTWGTAPAGPIEPAAQPGGVYQEDPPPWQPTDFDG